MIIHNPKALANFLQRVREQQGLTQSELGEKVGLKQATVSAFENKPEGTKLETLFRLLASANIELRMGNKDDPNLSSDWTEEW